MSRLFGPIMQNGFVVSDWQLAAQHWSSVLGVGPFFVLRHIEYDWIEYRGERVEMDVSVAIAYTGTYQVELVQQHNDEPSVYNDYLQKNPPGLQHVGVLVNQLEKTLEDRNLWEKVVQQGRTATGVRFAYVDTELYNGTMLELIETSEASLKAFDYMESCARDWDGCNPIRG